MLKLSCIVIVILLSIGCAVNNANQHPGPFKIADAVLSKGIGDMGDKGIPIEPSTVFTTSDSGVYALISYNNLRGEHHIGWKWFDPEGNLYAETRDFSVKTASNLFIRDGSACDKLDISGTDAASLAGKWKVDIFLDNALVASRPFDIRKIEKKDAGFVKLKDSVIIKVPDIDFGNYHALVIGINAYEHLPKLKTAVNDAEEISRVLNKFYGYEVKTLLDVTRSDIILALGEYRKQLGEHDNFLIYYAGHGWMDEEADEGYWLPMDAATDNKTEWISNSDITSSLKAMHAKHILVIADSCYSGKLTRGFSVPIYGHDRYSKVIQKKARSVLCSGGIEPVIDSGGRGDNSVFASVLIDTLKENYGVMGCSEVFSQIRRPVILNSDQTPEYSDIRKAGHDGGEFLFVRRK